MDNLLKVYTVDWCGVCNYFKFIQPRIEELLHNNDIHIDIKYLDGESPGMNLEYFPVIVLEKNEQQKYQFTGDVEHWDIFTWLFNIYKDDKSFEIIGRKDAEHFEDKLQSGQLVFKSNFDDKLLECYKKLNIGIKDMQLVHTKGQMIIDYYKQYQLPYFVYTRNFNEGNLFLFNIKDCKQIKKFIQDNKEVIVSKIFDDDLDQMFIAGQKSFIYFYRNFDQNQFQQFFNLAKNYKNQFQFFHGDIYSRLNKPLANYLGVYDDQDSFVIIDQKQNDFDKYKTIADMKNLDYFIEQFIKNNLEPYKKNQINVKKDEISKQIIDDNILKSNDNIVVYAFTKFALKCKTFENIKNQFINFLHQNKIKFKSFDLDLNEHELIQPFHIPTLYLFFSNKQQPIQITKIQDLEYLKEQVLKNLSEFNTKELQIIKFIKLILQFSKPLFLKQKQNKLVNKTLSL